MQSSIWSVLAAGWFFLIALAKFLLKVFSDWSDFFTEGFFLIPFGFY